MKTCPMCGREVGRFAKKCKHCDFNIAEQEKLDREYETPRKDNNNNADKLDHLLDRMSAYENEDFTEIKTEEPIAVPQNLKEKLTLVGAFIFLGCVLPIITIFLIFVYLFRKKKYRNVRYILIGSFIGIGLSILGSIIWTIIVPYDNFLESFFFHWLYWAFFILIEG
ncbi:MAG: hypothetical protein HUJ61_04505 [Bacilli bacterium]|nr:hypothetical protein [Bacilli bacterium]